MPDEERREVGMVRVWLGKSHDGTGLMSGSGQDVGTMRFLPDKSSIISCV